MSDPTGQDRPSAGEGLPPRPQYGEYATPEEQRSRIQQPDVAAVYEPQPAPSDPTPAAAPSAGQAPAAADRPAPLDATVIERRRRIDRIAPIALLAFGAVNVIMSVPSYLNLATLTGTAMTTLGIPGEFTNLESARIWGVVAACVLVVGFAITAVVAARRLRRGRLAWWIPLVGALATFAVVTACIAVPLMGDPAFLAYSTSVG